MMHALVYLITNKKVSNDEVFEILDKFFVESEDYLTKKVVDQETLELYDPSEVIYEVTEIGYVIDMYNEFGIFDWMDIGGRWKDIKKDILTKEAQEQQKYKVGEFCLNMADINNAILEFIPPYVIEYLDGMEEAEIVFDDPGVDEYDDVKEYLSKKIGDKNYWLTIVDFHV